MKKAGRTSACLYIILRALWQIGDIEEVILAGHALGCMVVYALFCNSAVAFSLIESEIAGGICKQIEALAAVLPQKFIEPAEQGCADAAPLHGTICDKQHQLPIKFPFCGAKQLPIRPRLCQVIAQDTPAEPA